MFLTKATPERLSAFSDGVFAVLITVLVLELRPPEHPTFRSLLSLWPTWQSNAVSYVFIAIVWTNHHHQTLCLFGLAALIALKYPLIGLGICCSCLLVYLRPEAPTMVV